jgi:hypothetical protein
MSMVSNGTPVALSATKGLKLQLDQLRVPTIRVYCAMDDPFAISLSLFKNPDAVEG